MKPLTAVVKHEKAVYPYMSLEKRKKILPKRNACSLYPATQQNDAMITGNGTLRAEIYGDPFEETIVYGHELLYVPIRKNAPELPDMVGILPEVRRLLKEGEYDKASDAMREYWEKQGFGLNLYVTPDQRVIPMTTLGKVRAFELKIESEKHEFNNYLRSLDLLTREVTVRFTDQNGEWIRKTVPSFKRNLLYQTVTAPKKGSLNAAFTFVLPTHEDQGWSDQPLTGNDFSFCLNEEKALIGCAYDPAFGSLGYTAVTKIIREGGTSSVDGNRLIIKDTDKIIFVTRITRYEENFTHPLAAGDFETLSAESFNADEILNENRLILGKKMERSEIRLGNTDEWAYSSEELLKLQHSRDDLCGMLLEKLYDMGRFYLITDTGKLPPLYGQHNVNTNLQVCNGCKGALGSIHCDYNTGIFYHFSSTYPHHCWTGGLGWIYNELWGHYLVTGDQNFLMEHGFVSRSLQTNHSRYPSCNDRFSQRSDSYFALSLRNLFYNCKRNVLSATEK